MDASTDRFSAGGEDPIRKLLKEHDACFEILPKYDLVDGRIVRTGTEFDLCAQPDHDSRHMCPGCPECRQTYRLLEQAANQAIAATETGCREVIQAYDSALHMSPRRRFRPEVVLAIQITGDSGTEAVDENAAELRERLTSLGMRPA
ncbi:MAG: hypothetical protein JNL98_14860 [Bryobacterales bacterium]|nr:hypothetical protein [Bryobacterales bacterium]